MYGNANTAYSGGTLLMLMLKRLHWRTSRMLRLTGFILWSIAYANMGYIETSCDEIRAQQGSYDLIIALLLGLPLAPRSMQTS